MNEETNITSINNPAFHRIGIVGAGAWGTALAAACKRAGRDVLLWAREKELSEAINKSHENTLYLPGVSLDPAIIATSELNDLAACDLLLLVTPAQHLRANIKNLLEIKTLNAPFVLCSKGIELESGKILSRIVEEELEAAGKDIPVAILSGPSFAAEVARGIPTGVTLACHDRELGLNILQSIGSRTFRPYYSDDLVGTQICGAVKNVMAIACGVIEGRKMGDNARALLLTRGLEEIWRLASVMGAKRETLMGLTGLGDLTLTCSSVQSRNFSLGVLLGRGKKLADILAERRSVTEGVHTADAVMALARRHAVEMPICQAVNDTLTLGLNIDETIEGLLARPFGDEHK